MEKYRFSEAERSLLERLPTALGVYQTVDKRVLPLILSDGFCALFDYKDSAEAYRCMERDIYRDTHPDDIARMADAARRFGAEDAPYDVIYRTRKAGGAGYHIVHAVGHHALTESGVRLAYVIYTDEGAYAGENAVQELNLNSTLRGALREESLLKANYYDYLTGLPSMTFFFELAEAGRKTDEHSPKGRFPFRAAARVDGYDYRSTDP